MRASASGSMATTPVACSLWISKTTANASSTTDDAERWSIDIPDDFSGWKFIQLPFDSLTRKEIGNGAPNDGFNKTAVHGYAIGGFGAVDMGSQSYFVDQVDALR